jgi:hypothetical protein
VEIGSNRLPVFRDPLWLVATIDAVLLMHLTGLVMLK